MRLSKTGRLLYVFHSTDDTWLDRLKEIFTGPLGYDPEDWKCAWVDVETNMPSEFGQLMTVYRYLGMTPGEAVDTLVKHPDWEYLSEDWRKSAID